MDLQGRVNKGIKLLNRYRPRWRTKINTRKLRMEICTKCVLGQLYVDYTNGLYILAEKNYIFDREAMTDFSAEHGFTLLIDEVSSCGNSADWKKLAQLWRKAVNKHKRVT